VSLPESPARVDLAALNAAADAKLNVAIVFVGLVRRVVRDVC
jgi:hypothetical protein